MRIFMFFILTLTSLWVLASDLKPFKSDGCSAFPDGTWKEKKLWHQCCYQHDVIYWQGGTEQQRKHADEALKSCVAKVGKPLVAKLMFAGVRAGGSPYLPTKFRWGYGWPYFRGYKHPTPIEKKLIDYELNKLKQQDKNQ